MTSPSRFPPNPRHRRHEEAKLESMLCAADATEHAVLDALLCADEVTGFRGHHRPALRQVLGRLAQHVLA